MSKSGGGGRGRSRSHGHGHGGGGGGGGGHGGGFGGGAGGQKKAAAKGKSDYQQRSLRRQMQSAAAATAVDEELSDNERDREPSSSSGGTGSGLGKQDYAEEPKLTEALHAEIFSAFNQYLLDQELNKFNSLGIRSADAVLARRFQIVRPMSALLDLLSNPHGSVKLSQGDTCVVVGFYGPSDTRMSKELPHRGVVDVIYRPKVTGASQLQVQQHDKDVVMQEERTIEAIITSIFETVLYLGEEPAGTGFNVILQEYENDGCLLSACINATSIAILDGCASMRNTVASVTAVVVTDTSCVLDPNSKPPEPQLIIDPSADQLKKATKGSCSHSQFIFAFTNDRQVLYSKVNGRQVTRALYMWVMDQCLRAAGEIFAYYEHIMKRKRGIALDDDDTTFLPLMATPADPEMEVISSDEDEILVQDVENANADADVMEVEENRLAPVAKRGRRRGSRNVAQPPRAQTQAEPKQKPKRTATNTKAAPVPASKKPVPPVIDVEDLSSDGSQERELEDGEID